MCNRRVCVSVGVCISGSFWLADSVIPDVVWHFGMYDVPASSLLIAMVIAANYLEKTERCSRPQTCRQMEFLPESSRAFLLYRLNTFLGARTAQPERTT